MTTVFGHKIPIIIFLGIGLLYLLMQNVSQYIVPHNLFDIKPKGFPHHSLHLQTEMSPNNFLSDESCLIKFSYCISLKVSNSTESY